MRLNIAFDLDCTLVDMIAQVRRYLENDGYALKDICRYDMTSAIEPQMTEEQLWQYFKKCYERHDETPVCEGVVELLEMLYAKSQKPILIVTQRPSWAASQSYALVERFLNVPFVICFADKRFGKIAYLNDIDYFVEDRKKTAKELAAHGKKVFMIRQSWNNMPANQNIIKIDGIGDLIQWSERFVKD